MAKKQTQKLKPNEVKTSITFDKEVFRKLKNASDITGRTIIEIVDQALRGLLGIPTPTIKEQLKKLGEK
jgi:hypothetical protein